MKSRYVWLLAASLLISFSCRKSDDNGNASSTSDPSSDGTFEVITHHDNGFESLPKKTSVFGIPIYGASGVSNAKMLHAANIMAQYMDNDEDGVVDNQLVLDQMLSHPSFLVMWKSENDLDHLTFSDYGQDLGNDETTPEWHRNGHTGRFDASLEEILHLITHTGYAHVYPEVLGEYKGTEMANAMDKARGGQFDNIPPTYPSDAWYTYDDATCDYSCQVTEYTYWALTSLLGAQDMRAEEIGHEWKLNTKDKMIQTDIGASGILMRSELKLPSVLPDGTYRK